MNHSDQILQDPSPGRHLLRFRGDTLTFALALPAPKKGSAWIRTNIGHADITREEIFQEVLQDTPLLGRDWFDIPMIRVDDRRFKVTLPLCEVGYFEAKCFFLDKGKNQPIWPAGPNTVVNVEPADTCCANTIYNAFVRQFGPNKNGGAVPGPQQANCIKALDGAGYAVIPRSGTFRDLIRELDFIIGELGCRTLQLLPIHPTPTTYGRMGRFGSPFAALNFTAVDPALAEFDPRATPMEQFIELVDAVHERNSKIFIDIAINHTGWAAQFHETHPEWLVRNPDGRIEVPGAWGVAWEDLTRLDYSHKDLWRHMAKVFLKWCQRGVDGFRCDAGYMIPIPAWKYIIAAVRKQFPDTVFLLEGLGGKISVTRDLLNIATFDWAYSELFQNYDRGQIENYLPGALEISQSDGILVHFAETHDNNRLAARSAPYAKMRTALCALCSHQGAFGFANGVEWHATEKIDVHDSPSLNWGSASNQVDHIRRLNTLLRIHPAFSGQTEIKLVPQDAGNCLGLLRSHLPSGKKLLILVNLDDGNQNTVSWDPQQTGMKGAQFTDLLTGAGISPQRSGGKRSLRLDAGQVLCLTADPQDLERFGPGVRVNFFQVPEQALRQRMRAKALEVFRVYAGAQDLGDLDPDQAAQQLAQNPIDYCQGLNRKSKEPRVTTWQWPRDVKRQVMVPPGHFLLVRSNTPFRVQIVEKNKTIVHEESLPQADGAFFALFPPLSVPSAFRDRTLKLSVYSAGRCEHADAPLVFLPGAENVRIKKIYRRQELLRQPLLLLGTNGRGGMLRARASWETLASRYDALLGANLNSKFPEDRWIMFTRCRAWIVFQDFSQDIDIGCLNSFHWDYRSRGFWHFHVPAGQGEHLLFTIGVRMPAGKNVVQMAFFRHPIGDRNRKLADDKAIKLILRPDIENRNFHETTKAHTGPEHLWPASVQKDPNGFTFTPDPYHALDIRISQGSFIWEPEWQYMAYRPQEAERGLDPDSDLFSPGYFSAFLTGGQRVDLTAQIFGGQGKKPSTPTIKTWDLSLFTPEDAAGHAPLEALSQALDHYVVRRDPLKSVIAGYPWFLDWGRDSLIFVRGLIADKRTADARAVLKQFGRFETDGTLPNMIRGADAGNRDTSDAPLWFFLACSDLIRAEGDTAFLDEPCGDRTIGEILVSIGRSLVAGTPNGIRMDPESGLIFSPGHFTWMDTNHPAGTPRQGYPIEIQALWFAALGLLARMDTPTGRTNWKNLARQVQTAIQDLFFLKDAGYLSDCLHAPSGEPARQAEPDDALRPNQLFAVTFGAVADSGICRKILSACEELLVPGAIRSLADRPVRRPLPVVHHGKVLNDPKHPYQGNYQGDEDTSRKPAYHNGTAWTWVFPSFCEAWVKVFGDSGKKTALAWLASSIRLMGQGCVGHVPEILDGDFPHRQRGCDAQAWGVSELLRVWRQLVSS